MTSTISSHGTTLSVCKPASFWLGNMILLSFEYKVLQKCCRVKTSQEHGSSFGIFFFITKRAQVPEIRITEQPICRLIVLVINFLHIFA